jgi:hypothetical protein
MAGSSTVSATDLAASLLMWTSSSAGVGAVGELWQIILRIP